MVKWWVVSCAISLLAACTPEPSAEWPEWLFFMGERMQYQTATNHTDEQAQWVYENRYVQTVQKWPYAGDNERYETFLDCETLNLRIITTTMAGERSERDITPDDALSPEAHQITYSRICEDLGLPLP